MKTTPKLRTRSGAALALLGSITLVGGLFAPVAGADPADQAGQGQERAAQAQASDETDAAVVTEDNDTNDGGTPNDVVDDGDNEHPSGMDRSVENGGSGNQGNAQSDPDDDGRGPDRTNGGPDQPGGTGGDDLADQDGNNGCGNDDDFEDDNEGLCGGPEDVCPNIPGNQAEVPAGFETDADGDCVEDDDDVLSTDVCPNIPGDQDAVPAGFETDANGDCVEDDDVVISTDVCPNIPGDQDAVPAGFETDANGNCVEDENVVISTDVCPNIMGNQAQVPAGLEKDAAGNCVATQTIGTTPTPDEVAGVVITNPGTTVVIDQPAPQALTPEIIAERIVRTQAQPSSEVLGVQAVRGGQLPRTGSEATDLVALSGIILLAGGMMLVLSNRSNRRLATITNS